MQLHDVDVFIGGVIQGSERGDAIVAQGYRAHIRRIVEETCPGVSVYDPVAHHPGSVLYSVARARETFLGHVDLVRRSRAFVAYLPEASMGTAIEMWEAHRLGIPVITISPMAENWVVKLLSSVRCDDLGAFETWARGGRLAELLGRTSSGAPGMARA